jgi:ribonuclease HI
MNMDPEFWWFTPMGHVQTTVSRAPGRASVFGTGQTIRGKKRHVLLTYSTLRRLRNIAEACPGEPTNNRAELFAIIRALEETSQNSVEEIIIKTDSKYCIGCFSKWYKTWERNGWKNSKGEPVVNQVGGAFLRVSRSGHS